jgi:UDP-N-acetylmuramoyl-L-alanyl-D-glutamate--2,6-diaminopimelate ligase
VSGPHGEHCVLDLRLPGSFNVANAVAAFAALRALDVAAQDAARGIATVDVPGRMEPVDRGQGFAAIVDYAHSPDAVERALRVARGFARGRVLVVLGCGGDRDTEKRPVMGEVAARLADVLVVTDDNPRSEDPAAIRASMLAGARSVADGRRADVTEVGDRRDAIRTAVRAAGRGDVVLVLGKGHEQGQEVAGVVHPFDDRTVLAEALEEVRS